MAAKYALLKSANDKFHFNLKAGNGEVILSSQMYEAKASAEDGIASVKANSADDASYERKTAKDDSPFFNLKAGNGQIIGSSEMYSSTSAMENGIASVKKNGPVAEIDDQTG
ncbi:MAG: YegP family protein [Phycisphaeraceae bacterium]